MGELLHAAETIGLGARHLSTLCLPCAPVFTRRATGFVAGRITPGFTSRYAHPPGLPRHLTHGLGHPRVLGHKSFAVIGLLALRGNAFCAVLVHRFAIDA